MKPLNRRMRGIEHEEWRSIAGYEGFYEVSDLGRVQRLLKRGGKAIRRPGYDRDGYAQVVLSVNNVQVVRKIHRLVLEAFVGPPGKNQQTCHNNGNPSDNRLCNLRWDTFQNNVADKMRHGKILRGEQHPNAKLTRGDVKEIRSLLAHGWTQREVAKKFGIGQSHVHAIKTKKKWRS